MALNDIDKQILQEIVNEEGKCLQAKRCQLCPFRSQCLPEFLNPYPPTESQRFQMALNVLSHHLIVDDEMESDDLKDKYPWQKRS